MEAPESLLNLGQYYYVVVKSSVHAADTAVFGLNTDEINALAKRFGSFKEKIVNGFLFKATPLEIINALAQLGYKVVSSTGEAEVCWTLQRDL